MRKLGGTLATLLLVAAPALAGCGDEEKEGTAATRAGAVTPAPAPKSKIPAELSGMWTATLKRTQRKDPPLHALKKKDLVFKLKFLGTGGVDNGPAMFVENDDPALESAQSVTVSDDRIMLDTPDCQFAYAVKDEQLTWTAIGDDCPHDGLSAVLTAGPWQRTTG
jgi:hypothetical protein